MLTCLSFQVLRTLNDVSSDLFLPFFLLLFYHNWENIYNSLLLLIVTKCFTVWSLYKQILCQVEILDTTPVHCLMFVWLQIDLQWMVLSCDPTRPERETCDELPVSLQSAWICANVLWVAQYNIPQDLNV